MNNSAKKRATAVIDSHAEQLIAFGEDILRHPELGFQEARTCAKVTEAFEALGITEITHPAKTGVKAWLRRADSPRIAIIGELDAVVSPQHPCAGERGAAHACGHNAQLAALLGCALGLREVLEELDGSVCLLAAPAEEYLEIGWRQELRERGEIAYLGGKQQLIAEGVFDDIDLAIMVHSETNAPYPRIVVNGSASGFIGKTVRFLGKEAHAGGNPWEGVNALNASALAISAIHFNRETFRDTDCVRVHPIITKGGDAVNTVPADVHMESYVRAATVEALREANSKVNRAIRGASFAVGADVEIEDLPGYLPLKQNAMLSDLFAENAALICPEIRVERSLPFCGSTDIGDVSYLLPVIQPTISGFTGTAHSKDFAISDPSMAYLLPAELMAATVIDLLQDGAQIAKRILASSTRHTKNEYAALWDSILGEETSTLGC